MNRQATAAHWRSRQAGYTLAEVIVALGVLGIIMVSLFGAFCSGLAIVQMERENLRATQILMQKMETVRLFTWSQVNNTNVYLPPAFSDWYNPNGTNTQSTGALYRGLVSADSPAGVPGAYKNNMRTITVTLFWTNYPHGQANSQIVRSRRMQTYVARYGMQNYVYK